MITFRFLKENHYSFLFFFHLHKAFELAVVEEVDKMLLLEHYSICATLRNGHTRYQMKISSEKWMRKD